jgi:ferredoxin-NADP reductase
MDAIARPFAMTFIKRELIKDDGYSFYFAANGTLSFIAGQYMQISLTQKSMDDRGSSRFFTIASSPTENYLMITTKRGSSSFKKALFALKENDTVQAFGPMGKFVLEEEISI